MRDTKMYTAANNTPLMRVTSITVMHTIVCILDMSKIANNYQLYRAHVDRVYFFDYIFVYIFLTV